MKCNYLVEKGRVTIKWTPVAGATSYEVYRRQRWSDTPEKVQVGIKVIYEQPVVESMWYFDIKAMKGSTELDSCSAYFPVKKAISSPRAEIGFAFPFRFTGGSVSTVAGMDLFLAQTYQAILTNFGERPMRFFFGANLVEFLFESMLDLGQFMDILLSRVKDTRFTVLGLKADVEESKVRVKLMVTTGLEQRILGVLFGM